MINKNVGWSKSFDPLQNLLVFSYRRRSLARPPAVRTVMGSELGLTADSKLEARLDGVGIWWICWATGWTLLLLGGMGFLIYQRRMPMLRVRGIGLSLCAISLLHFFWISVQLGYVLGPLYPGDTQYWIMSTYLPLGIGLFHASNTRFLHVAQRQKQYIERPHVPYMPIGSTPNNRSSILGRFKRLDHTTKVIVLVGSGMFFQVSVAPSVSLREVHQRRTNNDLRSYSWQFSCISSPGSGIAHGASQAPKSTAPKSSRRFRWVGGGSGEYKTRFILDGPFAY